MPRARDPFEQLTKRLLWVQLVFVQQRRQRTAETLEELVGSWTMIRSWAGFARPAIDTGTSAPIHRQWLARLETAMACHATESGPGAVALALVESLWPDLWPCIQRWRQHEESHDWTGCFRYGVDEPRTTAWLHIRNAVAPRSPFDDLAARRDELRRVLAQAVQCHPHLRQVACASWLNDLPPFQSLFPLAYRQSLVPEGAATGFGFWGQLVTRDGRLHERRAQMLLESGRFEHPRRVGRCDLTELRQHLEQGAAAITTAQSSPKSPHTPTAQ